MRKITFLFLWLLANKLSVAQDTTANLEHDRRRYIALDYNLGIPGISMKIFSVDVSLSVQPLKRISLIIKPYCFANLAQDLTIQELGLMISTRQQYRQFSFEPSIGICRVRALLRIMGSSCCPQYNETGFSARFGVFWKVHKNFNLGLSSHLNYHPSDWLYATMLTLRVSNGAVYQKQRK